MQLGAVGAWSLCPNRTTVGLKVIKFYIITSLIIGPNRTTVGLKELKWDDIEADVIRAPIAPQWD